MNTEPRPRLPHAVTTAAAVIALSASGCAVSQQGANSAPSQTVNNYVPESTPPFDPTTVVPPLPTLSPEEQDRLQTAIDAIPETKAYLNSTERNQRLSATVANLTQRLIDSFADADIKPEQEHILTTADDSQRLKSLAFQTSGDNPVLVRITAAEQPNGELASKDTTLLALIGEEFGIVSYARNMHDDSDGAWSISYQSTDMTSTTMIGPDRTGGASVEEVQRIEASMANTFNRFIDDILK